MEEFLKLPIDRILIISNFILILLLFILTVSSQVKINKLKAKYLKFMNGLSGVNIERVLEDCLNKVNFVIDKSKEIEFQMNTLERNMYYCIQKVGVVRYNAFDNVGSDLSFSIAMLYNNDDGLVISSLYARDSSSTYAKPVLNSKSRYALSAEEIKAIDIAKKTRIATKYVE